MKLTFLSTGVAVALMPLLLMDRPVQAETARWDGTPFAIPTFHCLGLYWSPPGGSADKEVLVRYRRQGEPDWKEALPMRYNPIPDTDEDLADYRGSIVHLAPATTYEIQLTLAGTSATTGFTATTWSEDFPVGETIRVDDRDTPLAITDSGTPEAYRVYDAGGEKWMTGHMYIFHNTIFRSDEWLPTGGLGGGRIVKHTVSRNNILHVRSPENLCASNDKRNVDNDYDYDLFNGQVPENQEQHGVRDEPIYSEGAGLDPATKIGRFQLAPESPGAGAGQAIPNFSDGYTGKSPDIGAHQRGAPPLRYGVGASQP